MAMKKVVETGMQGMKIWVEVSSGGDAGADIDYVKTVWIDKTFFSLMQCLSFSCLECLFLLCFVMFIVE